MKPGYRIEGGGLHFDGRVRALHCDYANGAPTRVIALTDEGVVSVPWEEIPILPCLPLLFLDQVVIDNGGDDAQLQ